MRDIARKSNFSGVGGRRGRDEEVESRGECKDRRGEEERHEELESVGRNGKGVNIFLPTPPFLHSAPLRYPLPVLFSTPLHATHPTLSFPISSHIPIEISENNSVCGAQRGKNGNKGIDGYMVFCQGGRRVSRGNLDARAKKEEKEGRAEGKSEEKQKEIGAFTVFFRARGKGRVLYDGLDDAGFLSADGGGDGIET